MYDCTFFVPLTTSMLGTEKKGSLAGSLVGTVKGSTKNMSSSMSSKLSKILNPVEAVGMVISAGGMVVSAGAGVVSAGAGVVGSGLNMAMANTPDRKGLDYVLTLTDTVGANGVAGLGELGTLTVTHQELLTADKHTLTKTCSIGNKGAMLEFRIILTGKLLLLLLLLLEIR